MIEWDVNGSRKKNDDNDNKNKKVNAFLFLCVSEWKKKWINK